MRRSVLQCFGQVFAADAGELLEVGEGARHLEQSVGGPERQGQAFAGIFQPAFVRCR